MYYLDANTNSVDEAIKYINEFGFLPLFKNDIDGFSLEERTVPEHWWSDDPEIDPWMWRAIIARRHDKQIRKLLK